MSAKITKATKPKACASAKNLTPAQEAAMVALVSHTTLSDAAKACGTSEATLYRWLQRPDFQARYKALRHETTRRAVARLQSNAGDAADVLAAIATNANAPANARVSAARALLEYALRSVEIEQLADELDSLRKSVEAMEASSHTRESLEY